MSDRPDIPPDDGGLAAEYVLGLLTEEEARAFRARLEVEPALRADVLTWERRFADMAAAEVAEVAPPARVQAALEDRLFAASPSRGGWIARVGLARLFTGFALAAMVVLWVLVELPPRPAYPPESPALTAEIAAEDGSLIVIAAYDADRRELYIDRQDGQAAPGRDLELWLIAGDDAPVSLGLLGRDRTRERLPIEAELAGLLDGAVLAISDEPRGGSPTGAPTGAVLALGEISEI